MMNLMNALLKTYDFALENDLVDNHQISENGQVLLPIYHSNRTSNGEDIFEMRIDENSNAIGGRFLAKDEVIVFPITEDSITRSGAKIAPHAICDELSYLAKEIDSAKNEKYLEGINKLLDYEKMHNCKSFRLIGEYICRNTIFDDFKKYFLGRTKYTVDDKFTLKYEIVEENGKTRAKSINLNKVFITFKIEKLLTGDKSVSRDIELHKFYIDYVDAMNKSTDELMQCNATGELEYCIERHRGLLGTAKLISISNRNETYYGRLKNGEDIYHISYKASQKIHNMLKFFLDSNKYKRFIGEDAYIINWLSHDLNKGGIELVADFNDDEEDDEIEETTMAKLGDDISNKLGSYFFGDGGKFDVKGDFYVLIIEKISNGRISMKYFRKLSRSEAYNRVTNWYESTRWKFYCENKSPSIYQIVNFVYGEENSKGYLSCENKKLMRSVIERLIPCIIDSKKLPKDVSRAAFHKLSNKISYKKSWDMALNIGCSLIKKHKDDYENYNIDPNKISEVKQLEESRSFYYGRLMAIYEKIELDAIRGRVVDDDNKKDKGRGHRITNSDRLWNSMIRTPERTRFILESKIKPYMNMLKKNNPGGYVIYDKLITRITLELLELDEPNDKARNSLNEDFILGYYYQKDELYTSRKKEVEAIGK